MNAPAVWRRRLLGGVVTSLLLGSIEISGQAPRWLRDDNEGLTAFRGNRLRIAEEKFRSALKQESGQDRNKPTSGMRREPYLPEDHLGRICARSGWFREARTALAHLLCDG